MTNNDLDKFKDELGLGPKPPEPDEIDLASVNQAMRRFGTAPVHPNYKRKTRAIYLSEQAMMGLQVIAARENLFVSRGTLMGSPSVSELMECIGLGVYNVTAVEGAPSI